MAQPETAAALPPAKSGKMMWVLIIVVGIVAAGGGIAAQRFLFSASDLQQAGAHAKSGRQAYVPFGDVVVNIHEERLSRYLRVKIILVVDEEDEKKFLEELPKKKVVLKNWLISYLCDRSLQEVRGTANINRLRREILDQFNTLYCTDGSEKIRDILFEEFVVQ